jgi:hypothetical protein
VPLGSPVLTEIDWNGRSGSYTPNSLVGLASAINFRCHPLPFERRLCGMSPAGWYALINSRVFLWIDPDRLNRQKAAREPRLQVVLVVDTAALVAAHEQRIAVTPINTRNARRKPACRGVVTFVPLAEWIKSGWVSEGQTLGIPLRKRSHQPVELTVLDAVPDILHFVINVVSLPTGERFVPDAASTKGEKDQGHRNRM